MILALDTSSPTCRLWLVDEQATHSHDWEAGRDLADGLIRHIRQSLASHGASWQNVSGIAVFQGPGSFTGLRIGLTVVNTVADTLDVPIVGATGERWRSDAIERLHKGESDRLVMPMYGKEPNITTPRK